MMTLHSNKITLEDWCLFRQFRKCSKGVGTCTEVFGKVQKAPENLQKTSGVHWDGRDRGKAKI